MRKIAVLVLLAATAVVAQTPDSPTMQALLLEVRQLRQDLQTVAVVTQRVQLLLYRMQLQDQVVKRLEDRTNGINSQIQNMERMRADSDRMVKETEERLAATQDPNQRRMMEQSLAMFKRRASGSDQGEAEQQLRVQQSTLSGELRNEKAKLTDLQERLDQIEKQLEALVPTRPQR